MPKILRNERGSYDLITNAFIGKVADDVTKSLCQDSMGSYVCEIIVSSICGINWEGFETDRTVLPNIFAFLAHSISGKQVDHYFQLIKSGEFRRFDHLDRNILIYNSTKPPLYETQNIAAPIFLYSGDHDFIVSEKDVDIIQKILPNVRVRRTLKNYNHCDFNYARSARELFFRDAMKEMLAEK